MNQPPDAPRGRAAAGNPRSRFRRLELDSEEPLEGRIPTEFLSDASRSVLARNDSPDVPFTYSLNPYRGCEHGCIYCYARPTHEYLGFSAGLDFETRILVKEEAPRLLRRELAKPGWQPQVVALSGVTDPYQPVERRLRITRGCLEVLAESRNPVGVITKNRLVTRDLDVLERLAAHQAVEVTLSITTLDGDLARRMEPRTAHPRERLKALADLAAAGVPCGVNIAPLIPGLNDHEIPAILERAAEAGATYGRYLMLRLPGPVEDLFADWLGRVLPARRERVLNRIRDVRSGRLDDSRFGRRMRGEGPYARQLGELFSGALRRAGLAPRGPALSTAAFRPPPGPQLDLFDPRGS